MQAVASIWNNVLSISWLRSSGVRFTFYLLQLSYKLLNMIWHSRYIISTITVYIVWLAACSACSVDQCAETHCHRLIKHGEWRDSLPHSRASGDCCCCCYLCPDMQFNCWQFANDDVRIKRISQPNANTSQWKSYSQLNNGGWTSHLPMQQRHKCDYIYIYFGFFVFFESCTFFSKFVGWACVFLSIPLNSSRSHFK